MDTEEFCLRWNNHHNVLVTVLDKLLVKESLVDVTLASEGKLLRVHRLVLCACSQYFEEMLSHQTDKQAIIFLKDVKFADLKALVDYMYKGEVNVAQDQLSSFLSTAEALNVKGLAYKEDTNEQPPSKPKTTNSKHSNKKNSSESPNVVGAAAPSSSVPVVQKPELPPQPVKSKGSNKKSQMALPINDLPRNSHVEADDHFISVDPKMESEMELDQIDDQLDANIPDWNPRDGDDDWSTSDPGLMVVPNSDSSSVPLTTCFAPSTETWTGNESVAGPSGNSKTKTNSSSISSNSRDKKEESSLKCPDCNRIYAFRSTFLRHYRYECGVEPRFQCHICLARFKRNERLTHHLLNVHSVQMRKQRKRSLHQETSQ